MFSCSGRATSSPAGLPALTAGSDMKESEAYFFGVLRPGGQAVTEGISIPIPASPVVPSENTSGSAYTHPD